MSEVEYRDIDGFPGYRVGDDGSVWTCRRVKSLGLGGGFAAALGDTWRRLGPWAGRDGRSRVDLYRGDGVRHARQVCLLVLLAFAGPRPPGLRCRHFPDADPANDSAVNLRWDTVAATSGAKLRGPAHPSTVYPDATIRRVRRLRGRGWTYRRIAEATGLSRTHCRNVAAGASRACG